MSLSQLCAHIRDLGYVDVDDPDMFVLRFYGLTSSAVRTIEVEIHVHADCKMTVRVEDQKTVVREGVQYFEKTERRVMSDDFDFLAKFVSLFPVGEGTQ